MFQVVPTVLVKGSTISLVTPYHLVYSLMRDILAFQCQTARYLPGRPLFSNKQWDNLGLYPCFHRVIAGKSVLVVCSIRLSRFPVVFALSWFYSSISVSAPVVESMIKPRTMMLSGTSGWFFTRRIVALTLFSVSPKPSSDWRRSICCYTSTILNVKSPNNRKRIKKCRI